MSPRALTRRYLIVELLPTGEIAGGYTGRHFLDFSSWCEHNGDPERAEETRDAVKRRDLDALWTIAAEEDLQPELIDEVIDEIADPVVYTYSNERADVPRYRAYPPPARPRKGTGRTRRGRRGVSRARTRSPGRSRDDDSDLAARIRALPTGGVR
jgi:hypothetical protein